MSKQLIIYLSITLPLISALAFLGMLVMREMGWVVFLVYLTGVSLLLLPVVYRLWTWIGKEMRRQRS